VNDTPIGLKINESGFGPDQALDVAAGRVVGAELVALAGVEGAFEQRAEDRGLDGRPVLFRGVDEIGDLVRPQRQGGGGWFFFLFSNGFIGGR